MATGKKAAVKPAKEHVLDVFWVLGELDRKNYGLWDQLTEEQRKEISPYMLLRWLAGCDEPEQLVRLGDVAALCIFELGQQKELLLKLLTACTVGGSKRYQWANFKGASKKTKALELIAKVYNMPMRHAEDIASLFSPDELKELALREGTKKYDLSARGYHRTIKLARTIADLEQSQTIEAPHILEALQYRQKYFTNKG